MSYNRLSIPLAIILLVSTLASACRPRQVTPDIHAIVATSMSGTQQARALSTLVASTFSALAAAAPDAPQVATPAVAPAAIAATGTSVPHGACAGSEPGKSAYVDSREGYCFLYPDYFFVDKPAAGVVEFLGPALDDNPDPLRARINITKKEPVRGRTLDEIAASLWRESRAPYHLSNIQLGGQDALVAENLVIGAASYKVKQLFFTHNGSVYLITLSPFDTDAPFAKALPDIQRFWDMAIPSFALVK